MPVTPYQKALAELLAQSTALEQKAVADLIKNLVAYRSELRKSLMSSGMFINDLGTVMASVDALSETYMKELVATMHQQAIEAYAKSAAQLNEMFMSMELAYPGVAVLPSMVENYNIVNTVAKITQISNELKGLVRATVLNGFYLEQRPFQVMQQLTHLIGLRDLPGFREIGTTGISAKAERIVRTEMMGTLNMAFWDGMKVISKDFPDLMKFWGATGDMRTRDDHLEAHGQIVPWEDLFVVGGEMCVVPCDPGLSPAQRCNCRCRAFPYRREWGPIEDFTGPLDEVVDIQKNLRAGDLDFTIQTSGNLAGRRQEGVGTPDAGMMKGTHGETFMKEYKQRLRTEYGDREITAAEGRRTLRDMLKPDPKDRLTLQTSLRSNPNERIVNGTRKFYGDVMDPTTWRYFSENSTAIVQGIPHNELSHYTGSVIKIAEFDPIGSGIHEFGHWVEERGGLVNNCKEFAMNRRAEGERMMVVGWKSDAIGYKDKWPDMYSGRVYKNATEVFSMGMQHLFENPARFAQIDPEYFSFVINILQGGKVTP